MDAGPDPVATPPSKTPVHLWIVGVLALLWNALGAFDYLATQLEIESYMKNFTPEQLEFFYGIPSWVVAAWAIAVWGAVLGSLGLLLRRAWAKWLFIASFAAMAITSVHNFGMSNGAEVMGKEAVVFSIIIWVIAIALLLYSVRQAKAGVLR